MTAGTEGLLRGLVPQALGAVARRYGSFADAEDVVQEPLLAAATSCGGTQLHEWAFATPPPSSSTCTPG